jgi:hypothetical protein
MYINMAIKENCMVSPQKSKGRKGDQELEKRLDQKELT